MSVVKRNTEVLGACSRDFRDVSRGPEMLGEKLTRKSLVCVKAMVTVKGGTQTSLTAGESSDCVRLD